VDGLGSDIFEAHGVKMDGFDSEIVEMRDMKMCVY